MDTKDFIDMLEVRIQEELKTPVFTEQDVYYNQGYVQALRELKYELERGE
jgi:hypothetical protein